MELAALQECVILYTTGENRDALFRQLMLMELQVTSSRYLSRPVTYKAAPSNDSFELWISDFKIHHYCHMHRAAFDFIYSLACRGWTIDPFAIRQQRSIRFQVFVALARLASSDPGSTISKLMCIFALSHGSVLIFAERFIESMLKCEDRFVRWPSAKRRRQLAEYGGTEFGFDGLIGSMDGTHFYLKRSPRYGCFPEAYFDTWHKGGYGYNCLLTADHTGSIIGSLVGWPGSQCDTVLQPHTALHQTPWEFLEKASEFIFVDCGFARTMYCVPPYKGASGKLRHNKASTIVFFYYVLTLGLQEFNFAQRQARCRVEHVKAILKCRLRSLNSIPIEIVTPDDHLRAQRWIRVCILLHNIFVRLKDEWEFEDVSDSDDSSSDSSSDAGDDEDNLANDCSGLQFQDAIRDRWLRANGWSEDD